MKDEEMAEKYSKSACAWIEDREPLNERDIQQAFLAGLKAGSPQWHDLRKAPNDLPKEVGNYLVCYIDTMLNRNVFILEFVDFLEDSHWIDETSHEIEKFDEGVIAWCEIPTFDKE
jgi:hypothetical protein